jgi:hypothetical protein
MATAFVSRSKGVQTKEQKKVSAAALRINTARRKSQMSGPVTVLFKMAPKEIA